MSDEEIEGEGFVFKDNRSSQLSEDEAQDHDTQEAHKTEPTQGETQQPFQLDFSTFIMSLTSSAFYHLGDIADPETGKTETNLPAVQQTIDMLIMLKEKTQGNLTEEEAKLLEQLVYELQMKFVAKSKK
ncbi:MAG: hypothetical protein CMH73_04380 [Nitrospina sp.]|jgi:hypothetical protein|nr:hypothetical protein [Nitrospina sp.]MDC0381107.1 DUF1844 domain-containing protein [Nitrospinota bacterium]|tara:strand:+ start:3603 stop:3989 length:387 start_codon:yes stop_codon:yes gene_type:complete